MNFTYNPSALDASIGCAGKVEAMFADITKMVNDVLGKNIISTFKEMGNLNTSMNTINKFLKDANLTQPLKEMRELLENEMAEFKKNTESYSEFEKYLSLHKGETIEITTEMMDKYGITMPGYLTVPKDYDPSFSTAMYVHLDGIHTFTKESVGNNGILSAINKGYNPDNTIVYCPYNWSNSEGKFDLNSMQNSVESVAKSAGIDEDRIAIAGASLGGYAALGLIANNPNYYSSAIVAGAYPSKVYGYDALDVAKSNETQITFIAGEYDDSVTGSINNDYNTINNNGGNARLYWVDGAGHEICTVMENDSLVKDATCIVKGETDPKTGVYHVKAEDVINNSLKNTSGGSCYESITDKDISKVRESSTLNQKSISAGLTDEEKEKVKDKLNNFSKEVEREKQKEELAKLRDDPKAKEKTEEIAKQEVKEQEERRKLEEEQKAAEEKRKAEEAAAREKQKEEIAKLRDDPKNGDKFKEKVQEMVDQEAKEQEERRKLEEAQKEAESGYEKIKLDEEEPKVDPTEDPTGDPKVPTGSPYGGGGPGFAMPYVPKTEEPKTVEMDKVELEDIPVEETVTSDPIVPSTTTSSVALENSTVTAEPISTNPTESISLNSSGSSGGGWSNFGSKSSASKLDMDLTSSKEETNSLEEIMNFDDDTLSKYSFDNELSSIADSVDSKITIGADPNVEVTKSGINSLGIAAAAIGVGTIGAFAVASNAKNEKKEDTIDSEEEYLFEDDF